LPPKGTPRGRPGRRRRAQATPDTRGGLLAAQSTERLRRGVGTGTAEHGGEGRRYAKVPPSSRIAFGGDRGGLASLVENADRVEGWALAEGAKTSRHLPEPRPRMNRDAHRAVGSARTNLRWAEAQPKGRDRPGQRGRRPTHMNQTRYRKFFADDAAGGRDDHRSPPVTDQQLQARRKRRVAEHVLA